MRCLVLESRISLITTVRCTAPMRFSDQDPSMRLLDTSNQLRCPVWGTGIMTTVKQSNKEPHGQVQPENPLVKHILSLSSFYG